MRKKARREMESMTAAGWWVSNTSGAPRPAKSPHSPGVAAVDQLRPKRPGRPGGQPGKDEGPALYARIRYSFDFETGGHAVVLEQAFPAQFGIVALYPDQEQIMPPAGQGESTFFITCTLFARREGKMDSER